MRARIRRASPWRAALVAGAGWSHANNTSWERHWLHPDMEADRRRHDEWTSNAFSNWGTNSTYDELEVWPVGAAVPDHVAGAMTEVGTKVQYRDLQQGWIFNSNWVNTIFKVA